MAKLQRKIKGRMRCTDGVVVPIRSERIAIALRDRDELQERVVGLQAMLDAERLRCRGVVNDLDRLRGQRWHRLGRWLGMAG